ncbi:MAG: hypothetical protein IPQ09_14630 [Myxococcales bacterium]|nr:hypothetical protein [Myxococcales bacterium]
MGTLRVDSRSASVEAPLTVLVAESNFVKVPVGDSVTSLSRAVTGFALQPASGLT